MFRDRTEAGQKLAAALADYKNLRPLILALPRGGVVVGAAIARALDCELDVLLVKKLRHPAQPELAVGAISEDEKPIWNDEFLPRLGIDRRSLDHEVKIRLDEIHEQQHHYRAVKPCIPRKDRTVILVDDGLATGATMRAAIEATAREHPASIIVAVPGGATESITQILAIPPVNDVVCLEHPPFFSAVGELYQDFRQVEDEEVIETLRQFETPAEEYGTAP